MEDNLENAKLIISVIIFTSFPFALGFIVRNFKVSRKFFSFLASFSLGLELFIVSIVFLEGDLSLIVGVALLFFVAALGYPMMYWLYPVLERDVLTHRRGKS